MCGDPILTVHLADNPGDGVVSFRFTGSIDSVLAARLETAFEILADIVPADRVL
ncbi:hypothetical protein [Kribbella orskensis]|uniref:hypothetical protein n=1 Tax=Kribbella orskensis TaxID=2512216 RepID=UPI0013051529|nr:hypothetical protein [Kribbella orskensis]